MSNFEKIVVALLGVIAIEGAITAYEIRQIAKNGFEVDMIADWKHSFAIEVKSKSDSEKKLSGNVRNYVKLRHDNTKGYVYYLGDVTSCINDVQYVAWKDWGTIPS